MNVVSALPVDAGGTELYAPWGRRLVAWLIDGLLVLAVDAVLTVAVTHNGSQDAPLGWSLFYSLVLFLGPPVYFTASHGGRAGQTLGKRAVGIAVRDAHSLGRLGYGRAFARWLVTALFWLFLLLPGVFDGLSPLGDATRRAWHDRIVGSMVIRL